MAERKRSVHPKLEALGWEDCDPTEVINLGLERLRRSDAASAFRKSAESLAKGAREHVSLDDDEDEDEDDIFDDVPTDRHAIP